MDEADLIPISALQHTLYCVRQCALIHVEQVWAENRFTAEGRILHDKTDQPGMKSGAACGRSPPCRSVRCGSGVSGIADVVELHNSSGKTIPFPVEYKRGSPKGTPRRRGATLRAGDLPGGNVCGRSRRGGALLWRNAPSLLPSFLTRICAVSRKTSPARLAKSILAGVVPRVAYEAKRCRACSLLEICQPRLTADGGKVARWLDRVIGDD